MASYSIMGLSRWGERDSSNHGCTAVGGKASSDWC